MIQISLSFSLYATYFTQRNGDGNALADSKFAFVVRGSMTSVLRLFWFVVTLVW